ncbi:MAG: hypothetical protein KG003_07095 [Bacteroidetes bacterium]|nr:hypothetical protein [Bacteroidota bacterium]
MKKLLSFSFVFMVVGALLSQAPNRLSYQAVVRNSSGVIVASGTNVGMRFTIHDGSSGGTVIYQETTTQTVNNNFGQVAYFIGSGSVQQGAFPTATQWASGAKFLQIEIDPAGGSSYTDLGAVQLMSVPYAQYANSAGSANTFNGNINLSQINQGGAGTGQVLQWNGTNWVAATVSSGGGGDITDVNAGTGMTGGGTSGSVTLNADNANALWNANKIQGINVTAGATNGYVLKFNGTNWAAASDDNTTYTAGTGLSLSGTTLNSVWTASGNNIYNNNSGNIGINTTSPQEKFHLKGTGNSMGRLEWTNGNWLSFYRRNTYIGYMGLWNDSNAIDFGTSGGGGNVNLVTQATPRLVVMNTGEVHVNGSNANSNSGYLTVNYPTYNSLKPAMELNGDGAWFGFKNGTTINGYLQQSSTTLTMTSFNGDLRFASDATPRMYIKKDGEIGVNTSTPQARFHVNGSSGTSITNSNSGYTVVPTIYATPDTSGGSPVSAAVLGIGKGSSFLNTGIHGYSGNSASFNFGGLFEAKGAAVSGRRNYGIYSEVTAGYVFTIGSYMSVGASTNSTNGVYGHYTSVTGSAAASVYGGYFSAGASNTSTNYAVYGTASSGATNYAGYFSGNVYVSGTLSKGGGSFQIDHPQDPENKYLIHSFVESPDMMNVYNGNTTTDAEGNAIVALPTYFEAENVDFKYQLTVIGQFAQAIVATEISDNKFTIKTDKPNVKVSWQVTGVRNDKWANANKIIAEKEKEPTAKGKYLHPELYGQPVEKGIHYVNDKDVAVKK